MKKVITYGTFDLFHIGHYNILKRAKEYGDYLIVGVTADRYDIERGKLSVHDSLAVRIENVRKTGFADLIIVEEYLGQKITDIIKYNIDVFVIGDDWKGKFDCISNYCELVYLERTEGISSTKMREKTFNKHNIGIITDKKSDNQIFKEVSALSGTEVTAVFSEDKEILKEFEKKYNVNNIFYNYEDMFKYIDIVFIELELRKRYKFILNALNAGKHVICDTPFALDVDKGNQLFEIANQKKLLLLNNLKMVHSQVFHQFIWIARSGLIGNIIDFNCSVSKNDSNVKYLFYELLSMALCAMIKIMGLDYSDMKYHLITEGKSIEYASLYFDYKDSKARLNIGNKVRVDNKIEVVGTKGTLRMGDNWWRANYFEWQKVDDNTKKIFNMNFDGNGFKFLLRDTVDLIENNRYKTKALTPEESIKMIEVLQEIKTLF